MVFCSMKTLYNNNNMIYYHYVGTYTTYYYILYLYTINFRTNFVSDSLSLYTSLPTIESKCYYTTIDSERLSTYSKSNDKS